MKQDSPDSQYIEVTYFVESELSLEKAANHITRFKSTVNWDQAADEFEKVNNPFAGRLIEITNQKFDKSSKTYAGQIRVAFPWRNFGPRIPNLISNLFGELFELKMYRKLKVIDILLPDKYIEQFRGPQFGYQRIKELIRFEQPRPLIGAVFTPSLGLSNHDLASLAYEAASGGVDLIKDDEVISDSYFSLVEDRVKQISRALKKVELETGRKVLYAVNITDRVDMLKQLSDVVLGAGGNSVMINVSAVGLSALRVISEKTKLPIFCDRVFTPAFTRSSDWGLSMKVFMKLCRLAGGDIISCGGINGPYYESNEEVIDNSKVCLEVMGNLKQSLPVNFGDHWAGSVSDSFKAFGHNKYLHLFGKGIFAHPDGARDGAKSVIQAYEATINSVPLADYAKTHSELKQAVKAFEK
ncbi:MAG: RuBisCO large subunit C-terminal-like domain-containing protein [bacterium]